jgi:hypothetical protein
MQPVVQLMVSLQRDAATAAWPQRIQRPPDAAAFRRPIQPGFQATAAVPSDPAVGTTRTCTAALVADSAALHIMARYLSGEETVTGEQRTAPCSLTEASWFAFCLSEGQR